MSKPTLNAKLRPNKETMEINIMVGSIRAAGVIVSAEHLDKIMRGLAQIRSKMKPSVPTHPPTSGNQISNVLDQPILVNADQKTGGIALTARHPGVGWVAFHVLPSDCRSFLSFLQRWAASDDEPPIPVLLH